MNMNMLRSIGNSPNVCGVGPEERGEKSNDIHKRGYTGPLYIVRICSLN